MRENRTSGSEGGGRKHGDGSRTEARSESDGQATGSYGRCASRRPYKSMFVVKLLKYIRVTVTVAVIAIGASLVVSTATIADRAEEQVPQDKAIFLGDCEDPIQTTVFCYWADCIDDGDECSEWAGACFSIWGGYCE